MIIDCQYSAVQDLMYHVLAHMKVDNASNLYSEAYIDTINKVKHGRYDSIAGAVAHLSNYYNENFERLGVINFLPFVCASVQDLLSATEHYWGFTETDKEEFIFPLNQLLRSEFEFYEDYWSKLYDATSVCRKKFELWLNNEMSKYEALFSYFNKAAGVGISYSLTNNGRGYENASSFNAIVPFAFDESKYKGTFYQILHEYTHQFTDKLLGETIRMDDGTHDMSETMVILFDYYLIKRIDKADIGFYLEWIGSLANIENCNENLFQSIFKINGNVNEKLLELLEKIIRG